MVAKVIDTLANPQFLVALLAGWRSWRRWSRFACRCW